MRKDKLWAIGMIELTNNKASDIGVDPATAPANHNSKPFAKVTARPTDRDGLEFQFSDEFFRVPESPDIFDPANTIRDEHGRNPIIVARWTRTSGNRTLFEARGGGIYIRDYFDPHSGDFVTPGRVDSGTGVASVNTTELHTKQNQNQTAGLVEPTNRDDFRQHYDSIVLQAYKRLSHRWQLQGSYQWERSEGFSSGATTSTQVGPGTFGADLNQLVNAYGRFPADSAHSIRVSSTVELPYRIQLALRSVFESGRPYGRLITVRGLAQGNANVVAEARGTCELPSRNDLGTRVGKDIALGARMLRHPRHSLQLLTRPSCHRTNRPAAIAISGSIGRLRDAIS